MVHSLIQPVLLGIYCTTGIRTGRTWVCARHPILEFMFYHEDRLFNKHYERNVSCFFHILKYQNFLIEKKVFLPHNNRPWKLFGKNIKDPGSLIDRFTVKLNVCFVWRDRDDFHNRPNISPVFLKVLFSVSQFRALTVFSEKKCLKLFLVLVWVWSQQGANKLWF